MQTRIVKADAKGRKGRLPIRGARKGREYLVTTRIGGWWVTAVEDSKRPAQALETAVADTWEKLGPAPDIDYLR